MAEGGIDKSLKDGSDTDFELVCTPCSKDNIREEANKYCPECQEYLCKTCMRVHGRLKATQEHKLSGKNNVRQGVHVAVVRAKCTNHPDRDIEMYCGTHDMVYCTKCIATEHRSCDGVNVIEDVSKQYVTQTEIQGLLQKAKDAQDTVMSMTVKQKNNLTAIDEQKKAIEEKIDDKEKKLVEHIRKLKNETTKRLNDKHSEVKESLATAITLSSRKADDLKQSIKHLRSVDNLNIEQQFVRMKLIKKTISDANILIADDETDGTQYIEFKENKELTSILITIESLGDVASGVVSEHNAKQRHYILKSTKKINVMLSVDNSTCSISDICKLPDGMILMTDYNNRKIKRLNTNDSVEYVCDLDASPTGICNISNNEIAVKLRNNKIQFLSVGLPLSKGRSIDIANGRQFGLTSCCGNLWSSYADAIMVYSTSSSLIDTISKDHNGKTRFKSNTQHMTVISNTVIVTDCSDGAVCLNQDGTIMRELRDSRLKYCTGVCVADNGIVFLCGYNSNNIVMFNKKGKSLGELVGEDSGLKSPFNMLFDRNTNRLLVTTGGTHSLFIIELCG